MGLDDLRNEIDEIDDKIMELLNRRFKISGEIGKLKMENNLSLEDHNRENIILNKTKQYENGNMINEVYQRLFYVSKKNQNFDYSLLGKSLPYSISPLIHQKIVKAMDKDDKNFSYLLYETDNPENAILNGNFKGMNVTIPYKEVAYKLCDSLGIYAKKTGVVNTLVKNNGKISGYNTDYLGVLHTLNRFKFDVCGKKVIIIGNGATSKTVKMVLKELKADKVISLVRTIKGTNEDYISNYHLYLDYQFIINCTPYGTYPNFQNTLLFPIDEFKNLEGVFDCIYNPLNPVLIEKAKKLNVKAINGLYMLVCQAVYSEYLFHHLSYDKNITNICDEVYKSVLLRQTNIAFVGMPYSGKSYKGKRLASEMGIPYVDSDAILHEKKMSLEQMLKENKTIKDYRNEESKVIAELSSDGGKVISTGGGVITVEKNIEALKRNSKIVYVYQPLEVLESRLDDSRPLIKGLDDLKKLYDEREPIYRNACDVIINGDEKISEIKRKVLKSIYEDLDY